MLLAVHYRVMEHLGSLESTQEARVALGYRLGQLLRFFRALQTSRVLHNSIEHAKAFAWFSVKVTTCSFHDKSRFHGITRLSFWAYTFPSFLFKFYGQVKG